MTGPPALLISFDPESWTITESLPIADSDVEERKLREIGERIREALGGKVHAE